jgi:hypothetical protein
MSRIHIDFAAPGWRRTLFRLHPAVLVLAVAGALLCAAAGWSGYRLAKQREARDAFERHRQERSAARSHVPAAPVLVIPEAQAAAINAAILQLNLPWRDLQEAVGTATPPAVAMLAMEPDSRKSIVKLTAEVKNSEDMIAYIEALKQQEFFNSVVLTRHEVMEQDPNRPIRFQVEAGWADR